MSTINFEFWTHGTRQICHLCNGVTEKFEMCAEGKVEGWDENFRVCARCLKAGQKQVDVTLRETIVQMYHRARACEGIARWLDEQIGILRIPSLADWQAEVDFRNAAWEVEERAFAAEKAEIDRLNAAREAEEQALAVENDFG